MPPLASRKSPALPLDGPGERPPLVAEELAPEELPAQRPAVDGLEARGPPRAQPVERRRHQLLAGARLAHDHDGHVDDREAREAPEERLHRRALADEALEPRQRRLARARSRPPRHPSRGGAGVTRGRRDRGPPITSISPEPRRRSRPHVMHGPARADSA